MPNIFVYGTLKQHHGNHGLIRQCGGRLIGTYRTIPKYCLYESGIPFLWYGTHRVEGEVYHIPDEQLTHIDRLEGHPTSYTRLPVVLENWDHRNNPPVEAYLYKVDGRGRDLPPASVNDQNIQVYQRHIHY